MPGSQRPPTLQDPGPLAARSQGEKVDRDPRERSWAEKAAGSWGGEQGLEGLREGNLETRKYCNSFSN